VSDGRTKTRQRSGTNWRLVLRALRHRNYRLFYGNQGIQEQGHEVVSGLAAAWNNLAGGYSRRRRAKLLQKLPGLPIQKRDLEAAGLIVGPRAQPDGIAVNVFGGVVNARKRQFRHGLLEWEPCGENPTMVIGVKRCGRNLHSSSKGEADSLPQSQASHN